MPPILDEIRAEFSDAAVSLAGMGVGKLKVVFFVNADGKVRDVTVEQKLKKKYRN